MVSAGANDARFESEARLLEKVQHPNVVEYIAHGRDADGPWLAMEWLDGKPLSDAIAGGSMSVRGAVMIGAQIARALEAAHEKGIVHRDLKPSNVMVIAGRIVKLVDFGVAKALDASAVITSPGALVGTPLYMAPEQLQGREIGPKTDVFAFGVVMFEMLVGYPPFAADTPIAVLARIALADPPQLAELRPETRGVLAALVARALAKDPGARPEASTVSLELERLGHGWDEGPTLPGDARSVSPVLHSSADLSEEWRNVAAVAVCADDPESALAWLAKQATMTERLGGIVLALFMDPGAPDAPVLRAVQSARALVGLQPTTRARVSAVRASTRSPLARQTGAILPAAPGVQIDRVSADLLRDRFDLAWTSDHAMVLEERDFDAFTLLLGRHTPTVGRDAELAQLEALLAAVREDGAPKIAVVVGPPGQGKSRVMRELVRRHASQLGRKPLLAARFDPSSQGTPWGGTARAVRDVLSVVSDSPHSEQHARLGEAALALELGDGELALLAPLIGLDGPTGERLTPEHLRDGVVEAMVALLTRLAGADVALVVLEDAHWADSASIALVDALMSRAELPVAVVAFARPDIFDRGDAPWRLRSLLRIDLAPLGTRAAGKLVRSALGEEVGDDIVQDLVRLSAGNPLVLEELVRAHATTGAASASVSARSVFEARIARASDIERLVLRAAAVIGEVFWDDLLARLVASAEIDVGRVLADLERDELFVVRPRSRFRGARELGFRHALLKDAAYEMVPVEVRRELHALAAHWLVERREPDLAAVANHAAAGGLTQLAAELLLRVGRAAWDAGEPTSSRAALERAAGLLGRASRSNIELQLGLEAACRELGDRSRRTRHLAAARRAVQSSGDRHAAVEVQLRESALESDGARIDRARDKARTAALAAERIGDYPRLARARIAEALAQRELGGIDAALEALAQVIVPGVWEHVPPRDQAEALSVRGTLFRRRGQVAAAIDAYRRGVELLGPVGFELMRASLQNSLGFALIGDGRLAEARAALESSRETRRARGVKRSVAKVLANIGLISLVVADWPRASDTLDECVTLHRVHGDYEAYADTLMLRARAALGAGETEDAAAWLARGESEARQNGSAYDQGHAGLVRGWIALFTGDIAAAERAFAEARLEAARAGHLGMAVVACAELARTCALLDRHGEATALVSQCLTQLDEIEGSEWSIETYAALVLAAAPEQVPTVARRALHRLDAFVANVGDAALAAQLELRPEVRLIRDRARSA